jgi:hypothetical protein
MFKNYKDEDNYLESRLEIYREKKKKNIPSEIVIIEWI